MLLLAMLIGMPIDPEVGKPGLENIFTLGSNGICPVIGDAPVGFAGMMRGSNFIALSNGRRLLLTKTHERRGRATVDTIHLVPPVGTKWLGLPLSGVTVVKTAIYEGDTWEKYRLDFTTSKQAVLTRLATAGHPLGPAGIRKFSDDQVVPYGATESVIANGKGSSLICTTDG